MSKEQKEKRLTEIEAAVMSLPRVVAQEKVLSALLTDFSALVRSYKLSPAHLRRFNKCCRYYAILGKVPYNKTDCRFMYSTRKETEALRNAWMEDRVQMELNRLYKIWDEANNDKTTLRLELAGAGFLIQPTYYGAVAWLKRVKALPAYNFIGGYKLTVTPHVPADKQD